MDLNDVAPMDDAFIRTAIRGLRAPDHHRAFWDDLGGQLDSITQVLIAQGLLVDHSVPPLVVELPQAVPAPAPIPEAVDGATVHAPRRQPLRAGPPAHAVAAGAPRVRAFGQPVAGQAPSGWAEPGAPAESGPPADPEVVVRHDPAVVPRSLRRTSNAVLLAVALVAAIVAMVAGLSLVRQRSDTGGSPPPAEAPQTVGATG